MAANRPVPRLHPRRVKESLIPRLPDAILGNKEILLDLTNYLSSIVISLFVGLAGFLAAYKIFDWLTPDIHFGQQLRDGNRAVAIFLAGLFIGLGLLLGNAVK